MKRIIVGVGLALLLAGGCQRGEDQYQFPPEDHGPGGEVVEGADSVEGDLVVVAWDHSPCDYVTWYDQHADGFRGSAGQSESPVLHYFEGPSQEA